MQISLNPNISDIDEDLLKELSLQTTNKIEPNPENIEAATGSDPEPPPNPEHFSEKEDPIIPQAEPVETKHPFSHYLNEASAMIAFLSGISKMYLPRLYRKKYFTDEEYTEAKLLLEKVWDKTKPNIEEFTAREHYLYEKMKQLEKFSDEVQVTPDEADLIRQPLAQVLEKYQKTTSPETMLLIAIASVFGPKLFPLF